MGPPFIDGGSNPFGNKGADLIETIRLEGHRDGPGIYLGSAGVRGIAKPHPCVDTATNLPLRKRPDAGRKPWAERRPNSAAATVRVHNAEAVQRMLHGGGTSDAGGSQPASQQASEIVRSGASPVASHVESRASRPPPRARARRRNRGRRGRSRRRRRSAPSAGRRSWRSSG